MAIHPHPTDDASAVEEPEEARHERGVSRLVARRPSSGWRSLLRGAPLGTGGRSTALPVPCSTAAHASIDALNEGFVRGELHRNLAGSPIGCRLLEVNRAFGRLVGRDPGEIIAENRGDLLTGDDSEWLRRFTAVALSGVPDRFERRAAPLDRRLEVFVYSPAPGQFAATLRDVTVERLAARERARAFRRLERAHRHLAELARGAAHDLKAPMRAIATLARWIANDLAGRLDPATDEQLALIRHRVHRMHTLLAGMTRYAEAVDARPIVTDVALEQLVTEAVARVRTRGGPRLRLVRPMPVVRGDGPALAVAVTHLLRNAVDFHDAPGGEVVVRALATDDGWRVEVRDDGPGIAAEHHERIFRVFETVASRDGRERAGVGLALVRAIIEAHGGEVALESAPGAGATFSFTLPAGDAP